MENLEFIHIILPYAVSTVVFFLLGVIFYIKDAIFDYLDKKRHEMWKKKYAKMAADKDQYRIKQIKGSSKSA